MIFVLRKVLRIVFTITTKGKNEFRNKFFTNFETVCQVEQLNSKQLNTQGKYLEMKGLQMKLGFTTLV